MFGRKETKIDEVKRVCNRCGKARYLPAKLAREKAPNRFELAGARMTAAGSRASAVSFKGAQKQLQVDRLEEKERRVLETSQCPDCGSTDFTETPAD